MGRKGVDVDGRVSVCGQRVSVGGGDQAAITLGCCVGASICGIIRMGEG